MASVTEITPADLAQEILCLGGTPYSIKEYPYLRAIYNSPAREIGLFTARQIAKSTFLASKLVTNAFVQPNGRQVLVSPLMEQAYVFSMQRLKDFIHDSPLVKNTIFTGAQVVDQVLRKVFTNGHMITLGYAQRTADRLRGQSIKDGGVLGFDEVQDILPDVIPVVKELAFRAKDVSYLYGGTPKSFANHMEQMRARSTGNEWAVKCGCGFWNYEWDERNIGDRGVICARCSKPIDTNTGEWIRRRELDLHRGKDAKITMESFRVPQLIVKPIMDDPLKWRELLDKFRSYSGEKFYNEVLGLPFDSASQPITREQLVRCCDSSRPNALPDPNDPSIPSLVMGVDWAFLAENSYTFVVVGAWRSFPSRFDVYYWKCFKGNESDSMFQIEWIIKTCREYGIKMVGDWGPVYGEQILEIGRIAAAGDYASGAGTVRDCPVMDGYIDRLLRDLDGEHDSGRPLTVAWDAGNGACGEVLERLAPRLPGRHILLYTEIDGRFPNHHPDPTVPENLTALRDVVATHGCDLGIAFDGDGDRVGALDETGRIIWGDQLVAIYAGEVLAAHPGATVIADVKTSQTIFDEIARLGGRPLMWKTGHSLLKAKMAETGAPLAGEMSGHIFFADTWYGFDDALYCGIRLLRLLGRDQGPLSALRDRLPPVHNTPEVRFQVDESRKFQIIVEVKERLRAAGADVNDIDGVRVRTPDGWWLLRASNTQDVLVARCESETGAGLERLKAEVTAQLEQSGVPSPSFGGGGGH